MVAIFIGDDKDPRTCGFGLRTGQSYGVMLYKAPFFVKVMYRAQIVALVNGHHVPYGSVKAFEQNWRVIQGEKVIHSKISK